MQQHFDIHPSITQLGFILAGHASIALAIAAYTEPVAMMQGGLLVVGLLALRETSRLWLQDEISLMVNSRTATI
ncbi:MAG: hypothetical protein GY802_25805, partial [Gammaproteobacteria bacterium]|nr:hypothetical protein [Gammaproteobacteria bacterium]